MQSDDAELSIELGNAERTSSKTAADHRYKTTITVRGGIIVSSAGISLLRKRLNVAIRNHSDYAKRFDARAVNSKLLLKRAEQKARATASRKFVRDLTAIRDQLDALQGKKRKREVLP